uniref:RNA-directed RNA polymerase 2a n=1 Tax=Peanut stunt virus TaxID=12313 RepID=Q9YNL6_9BROM|nr:putative RNA dependent RNA polymerase [Peanut stunt virus]
MATFSLESLLSGAYGVDTPEEVAFIRERDQLFASGVDTTESVPSSPNSLESDPCFERDEAPSTSVTCSLDGVSFLVEDLNAMSDVEIKTVFENLIRPTYVGCIEVPEFCRNKLTLSVSVARNLISTASRYPRKLKDYPDLVASIYNGADIFDDALVDETISDEVPGYVFLPVERPDGYERPPLCSDCGLIGYQCACHDLAGRRGPFAEMTISHTYELESLSGVVDDATLVANLGSFLLPIHCEYSRVDPSLSPFHLTQPHPTDRVSVESLQAVCDTSLPTHVCYDDTYHQVFVENSDFTTDIDHLTLKQSDLIPKADGGNYLKPVLTTGSGSKRLGTTKEVLTAIKKRNADVPELSGSVDLTRISQAVRRRFKESYFNTNALAQSNFLNVVGNFHAYMQKWAASGLSYDDLPDLHAENLQFYEHMVKSDVKPVVADTLNVDSTVPATITFHAKGITFPVFPLFISLFERFQRCLRGRVVVPVGKISSLEMDNFSVLNKFCLEIDLSKFDKSQGELHLMIQEEILNLLGCPVDVSKWWCDFHRYSYIKDKRAGVSMPISFQRRTGDAFTYFGNTLVTMALFSWCYDTDQFDRMLFSGDDSLAFSLNPIEGKSDWFTSLFNMEAKNMDPPTPYICSKFLLTDELGNTFSVPDPLRELQRLGTKKIPDWGLDESYLRAHFMSFVDRLKFLPRMTHYTVAQLTTFYEMKYKKSGAECHAMLGGFAKYSTNFSIYKELYISHQKRFSLINSYPDDNFVVERKPILRSKKVKRVKKNVECRASSYEAPKTGGKTEVSAQTPPTKQEGSWTQEPKRVEGPGAPRNLVSSFPTSVGPPLRYG